MSIAENRSRQLSRQYYNRALDLAKIRDLSGAETLLRISLQFDKRNIQARNLLGLVYYETGEMVAALREWVISQNLQPTQNPASGYVADVRKNPNRLRQANNMIREYNEALRTCREGHDDVAAITLRRVVNRNPKFIKADLLMALIDIHEGHYARARRILRRAIKIDRHNPMILRYLQEIDENMGTSTTFELRVSDASKGKKEAPDPDDEMDEEARHAVQPAARGTAFRDRPAFVNLINILFGLGIGVAVAIFVVAPTVRASANRSANEQIVEYTTTAAAQQAKIEELQQQIDSSDSTASEAQSQAQNSQKAVDSYNNLIQAYSDYQNGDYEKAGDEIAKVDVSLLSTAAGEIYDSVQDSIKQAAYSVYVNNGDEAFYLQNWSEAAAQFEKALAVVPDDYDSMNLLAQAYENNGDTQKAIDAYQKIVDAFPNTRRAEYASASIEQLGGTVKTSNKDTSDSDTNGTDTSGTDTSGTDADGTDTSGTDTSGTNAAGTDTAGTGTGDTNAGGADTTGTDAAADTYTGN